MSEKRAEYKRFIFAAIIIIVLGIIFSTALKETSGSLGTVLVAVGGLFFIAGMSKKNKKVQ